MAGPQNGGYAAPPGYNPPPQPTYGAAGNRYAASAGYYAPRPATYGPPNGNYNAQYGRPADYATK